MAIVLILDMQAMVSVLALASVLLARLALADGSIFIGNRRCYAVFLPLALDGAWSIDSFFDASLGW